MRKGSGMTRWGRRIHEEVMRGAHVSARTGDIRV